MTGRYNSSAVATAAEMRACEERAIRAGVSEDELVARAGAGIADWVRRLAAGAEVLVLCGPGNNGADGYVAAAELRSAGVPVRVAALSPPRSAGAQHAAARWAGPVEELAGAAQAPIVVDALFGTGLTRPLDREVRERLVDLVTGARLSIAADLPSGLNADTARVGDHPLPDIGVDLTLALGALKPAHVLWPGAAMCGEVRTVDIGLRRWLRGGARVGGWPGVPALWGADHKYTRGMVAVIAGAMPGAARLAAVAAMRAGAGYVTLHGDEARGGPEALVHRPLDDDALADERINALVVGPGLGRDATAKRSLDMALRTIHPLVIDGDALHLVDLAVLRDRSAPVVLTPHDGEFRALFPQLQPQSDRLAETRAALGEHRFTLVRKGASTIVVSPGHAPGAVQTVLFPPGNPWLSTAGSGDVLAGAIAAVLARTGRAPDAAEAGAWLHADAARRCGASFIADDLAHALTAARASR